ncbi:MAG: hypothetical protein ACMG6E_07830 [Candidatus Roizmanbacteria bacterium]
MLVIIKVGSVGTVRKGDPLKDKELALTHRCMIGGQASGLGQWTVDNLLGMLMGHRYQTNQELQAKGDLTLMME